MSVVFESRFSFTSERRKGERRRQSRASASTAIVPREERQTVGAAAVENPRIRCMDVNVYYGSKQAIKNVSLDIGSHEIVAMIGPSGCGKSTFCVA